MSNIYFDVYLNFYFDFKRVLPAFHSKQLGLFFGELCLQVKDVFVEGEGDKLFTSWHFNFESSRKEQIPQLLSALSPFPTPFHLYVFSLLRTPLNITSHLMLRVLHCTYLWETS